MRNIIAETFIPNFFSSGLNLFAIVWEDTDYFGVQLGSKVFKYKRKENALKKYNEYLNYAKMRRETLEICLEDLKRFAVITFEDTIFCDSDDVLICQRIFKMWEGKMKGIYDYERNMYLDEADIIDLVGCQIHSKD